MSTDPRRPRLTSDDRARVRGELVKAYTAEMSIRALAAAYDLSYGLTRTLLLEADAQLRTPWRPKKTKDDSQ